MRLLIKKFFDLSMLWKFTLIYFFLIMLPTTAIWISYYTYSIRSIQNQSDKVMLQTISRLKQDTLYTIKNTESIAKEIIFSSEVQGFFNNDFTFSDNEVYYFIYSIQNKLSNIKRLYPNKYYKIRLFSSKESTEELYDIIYSINRIKDNDYFKKIDKPDSTSNWGKIKKTEEYYDINESIKPMLNNDKVIPLYEPIVSYMGDKLVGILEIDILNEKIFGDPSELTIGKNGIVLILDADGDIISSLSNDALKSDIHIDMFPENSGIRELKINKEKYRAVYDTISETGYKIIGLVPEKDILSVETFNKYTLFILIILGVITVFLIAYFTTKFLFNRFRVLIKMMKRIEGGEFDVRIDESRKDEVGELAHGFNHMAAKLEEMILNLIEKETAHRDAEVRALQSQINPHFLYNTLESLRMESELRGHDDIALALASLGKLFRYNIKWIGGLAQLYQEIDHVNNYITIMKIRYRGRIDFNTEILDDLLNCTVIKMMLQPLVENCFHHAFKNKDGLWAITIKGYISDEVLIIEIIDNGLGIEKEKLEATNRYLNRNMDIIADKKAGSSIGVWNVNKRIKMQFGDEYGINIESTEQIGTKVIIRIPGNKT